MIIRTEQLAAFRAPARESFVASLVVYARRKYPAFCGNKDAAALRAEVRSVVDEAVENGIRQRPNVKYYLDFLILNGLDCLAKPEFAFAKETIADRTMAEEVKVRRLSEFQTFVVNRPMAL